MCVERPTTATGMITGPVRDIDDQVDDFEALGFI